jgi:hypothetical protein
MNTISKKITLVLAGLLTAMVAGLTTGCASGGYKLTRQYAGWVNKQNIVLRIVLYLLTSVVFAVTLLIDAVIFNTMDFWEGRVSQGTFEYSEDGKVYKAQHKLNEGGLRSSQIEVWQNEKLLHTISLIETPEHKIQLLENGILKTEVDNIDSLPRISHFSKDGQLMSQEVLPQTVLITKN